LFKENMLRQVADALDHYPGSLPKSGVWAVRCPPPPTWRVVEPGREED